MHPMRFNLFWFSKSFGVKSILLLHACLVCLQSFGQIPIGENLTSPKGRQGKWVLLFDQDRKTITDTVAASYYRIINYKDDKPTGLVQDYQRNGKLSFSANMVNDRPQEILTGHATWFNDDGIKEAEGNYKSGLPDRKLKCYYADGSLITDTWQSLYDSGVARQKLYDYSEALSFLERAFIVAKHEFNKNEKAYQQTAEALSGLYLIYENYFKAEPLFIYLLKLREKNLGKEHPDYIYALESMAKIYYERGNLKKALPLYQQLKEVREKIPGREQIAYATAVNSLALVYRDLANYSKAEALFLEARDIKEKILGKAHSEYATTINDLAMLYYIMGNYTKAESLLKEALAVREKTLGRKWDYASTLNNLAGVYLSTNNLSESEPMLLTAKRLQDDTRGKAKGYAEATIGLAALYYYRGQYPAAEQLILEALEIQGKYIGKEHPDYASSLHFLAMVYAVLGNYSKAESCCRQSITIRELALGNDHPDYASSLHVLATIYINANNYADAEPLFLEEKEIYERVKGKENQEYAAMLNNLATLYFQQGHYAKAEPMYLESKEIFGRVLGKEHPQYTTSLIIVATYYTSMGDYVNAEPLFLEAKEIKERALGKDHIDYALSLDQLAQFYIRVGNQAKALDLYQEARAIRQKVLGVEHPLYATSLRNLGNLQMIKGDYSYAEFYFKEAIRISRRAGKENILYATDLNSLASVYLNLGDFEKAEPLSLEAINIQAKVLGKEHASYASALDVLANIYSTRGLYTKAEPLQVEAIAILEKALGKSHPDVVGYMNRLAWLYQLMGDLPKGEPLYKEIISNIQQQIIRYFPSMSEKEKQLFYFANLGFLMYFENFCVERFVENPTILSELYNLRLVTKGLLFNTSNKMAERILSSKDKILIEKFNQWRSRKDYLGKVYQMPTSEKKSKQIDEAALETEVNTLEKELSLKAEAFAGLTDKKTYRWEDVKGKLKPGEAALEVVRTSKSNKGSYYGAYAVLVVTAQTDDHPELILLENGDDLENKFSRYYRNTVKQKIKDEVSYAQFWKPIAEKLNGINKVYFSADGVYNQINLNTLYNPSTGKYVIDEMEIQMVTSTKDLITNTKATRPRINDATLFGYPDYNNSKTTKPDSSRALNFGQVKTLEIKTDSSARFFDGENINELPGTKVEVQSIEALLKKKGIAIHEFMFDKATEAEVKRLKDRKSVV